MNWRYVDRVVLWRLWWFKKCEGCGRRWCLKWSWCGDMSCYDCWEKNDKELCEWKENR